jgi:hypothetical protein
MMMRRFSLVLSLLAAGCNSPPGSIQVAAAGITPAGAGTFSATGTSVSLGAAIAFTAQTLDAKGAQTTQNVSASIDDKRIAEVLGTTTPNQFVLVGAAAGTTTLHLNANGDAPTTISVSVAAQAGQ